MEDIYALIDIDTLKRFDIPLTSFVKFIESLHIPIAQYRNKSGSDIEFQKDILAIKRLYSGRLIINDRLEFATMGDGIHIGQEDIYTIADTPKDAIKKIREVISSDKWIGLSTHNIDEIEIANGLDIDYIGLGAYRKTTTKNDATVSGDALLEIAKLSKHPVALIGGVRLDDRFDKNLISYKVIGSSLCKLMR